MNAVARQRLPDRRKSETIDVVWADKTWHVSIGFDAQGCARELFADGSKIGSEMEALLDDACILLSMLLQSGWQARELVDKLSREAIDPKAPAASILGLIVKVAAAAEQRARAEEP